jgi:phage-related protein
MEWTVETLNKTVDGEIDVLPEDMKARLHWIGQLIKTRGLERVGEPYVKHLQGPLWEMRIKGRDGISRVCYVVATRRRVVIVRVFIKKTQKTPPREIALALKRAKEIES